MVDEGWWFGGMVAVRRRCWWWWMGGRERESISNALGKWRAISSNHHFALWIWKTYGSTEEPNGSARAKLEREVEAQQNEREHCSWQFWSPTAGFQRSCIVKLKIQNLYFCCKINHKHAFFLVYLSPWSNFFTNAHLSAASVLPISLQIGRASCRERVFRAV